MKFCTDIRGAKMIHHYEFGDSLTFLLPLHEVYIRAYKWNISTTIGWIAVKFGTDIHDPSGWTELLWSHNF